VAAHSHPNARDVLMSVKEDVPEGKTELSHVPRTQMNKRTVALMALFAGWILTADIADARAYKDIAGQWCGDVTDYVFTPDTLTVKFHDSRPANVFNITKYTYTNDTYELIGSTVTAKNRSLFSLNSSAAIWRSRRTATNRAELSIAAETSSYLGKVGANLRGAVQLIDQLSHDLCGSAFLSSPN
jgi:hypothetical protein